MRSQTRGFMRKESSSTTHVRMIREEKLEACVGDEPPAGESDTSVGRRGGVAVDFAARAAADDAAASSISCSFCCWRSEGRRPGVAADCAEPRAMESTTEMSCSCFCCIALNWLITSSRLDPGATLAESMGQREKGYDSLHNSCGVYPDGSGLKRGITETVDDNASTSQHSRILRAGKFCWL